MVDVMLDRDALGDLGHAAEMVTMPMRRDEMINLRETGILGGCHDALGVADGSLRSSVAGIDQDGFAGWRDEQRGIAAFDIDHVNVERRARLCGGGTSTKQHRDGGGSGRG